MTDKEYNITTEYSIREEFHNPPEEYPYPGESTRRSMLRSTSVKRKIGAGMLAGIVSAVMMFYSSAGDDKSGAQTEEDLTEVILEEIADLY